MKTKLLGVILAIFFCLPINSPTPSLELKNQYIDGTSKNEKTIKKALDNPSGQISDVLVQIRDDENDTKGIRFVVGIDSNNYVNAQFDITIRNGTQVVGQPLVRNIDKAYLTIIADQQTLTPQEVFGQDYNCFIVYAINKIPSSSFSWTLNVSASITDSAGQTFSSQLRSISIRDIINQEDSTLKHLDITNWVEYSNRVEMTWDSNDFVISGFSLDCIVTFTDNLGNRYFYQSLTVIALNRVSIDLPNFPLHKQSYTATVQITNQGETYIGSHVQFAAAEKEYTFAYTCESGQFVTVGGSLKINNVIWNYSPFPSNVGFESERGVRVGSGTNPAYKPWTLDTVLPEGSKITSYFIGLAVATSGKGEYTVEFGD